MQSRVRVEEQRNSNDNSNGWSIDKKVPVALLITLLLGLVGNMITGVIFATKLDSRVSNVETTVAELKPVAKDVNTLTAQNVFIQNDITAIKNALNDISKEFIVSARRP